MEKRGVVGGGVGVQIPQNCLMEDAERSSAETCKARLPHPDSPPQAPSPRPSSLGHPEWTDIRTQCHPLECQGGL